MLGGNIPTLVNVSWRVDRPCSINLYSETGAVNRDNPRGAQPISVSSTRGRQKYYKLHLSNAMQRGRVGIQNQPPDYWGVGGHIQNPHRARCTGRYEMSKRDDMKIVRSYFRVTMDREPNLKAPDLWRGMILQHGKLCTVRTAQRIYNTMKRAKRPDPVLAQKKPMYHRPTFWGRFKIILRRWNL